MSSEQLKEKNPSVEEVRKFIREKIDGAFRYGEEQVTIVSGAIHDDLNMVAARPTVCSAMRTLGPGYEYKVIYSPPKGNGTTLEHLYLKYKDNLG